MFLSHGQDEWDAPPHRDGLPAEGNKDQWNRDLDALRRAALGKDPWGKDLLMPRILDAVKGYATVGEIIGALRQVWGKYTEPNII